MKRALSLLLLVTALGGAACRSSEPSPATSAELEPLPFVVEPLEVPARGDSGQPQLTASGRGVIISWLEQTDASATLKFSELHSGAWAAATTVASSGGWFVTDADVPTVMRKRDGTLV